MVAVLVDTAYGGAADQDDRLVDVVDGGAAGRPSPTVVGRTSPSRPTRSRPGVSITVRRRRLVAVTLTLLLAVTVAILFALQAALGGGAGGPLTTAAVSRGAARPAAARAWIVRPGNTLWGIAAAVQPHGDIRPLVDRLSAEVHGQPLAVGQRIPLP